MSRPRLLILDDDAAVAQTIAFIAENAGLDARITTTSTDFFTVLEEWSPDYIALDLVMPEMDGVEVLRLLAYRRCHAMIVLTSGVGSRVLGAAERSAAEHGLNVIGVVSKPFSAKAFHSILNSGAISDPLGVNEGAAHELAVNEHHLKHALDERQFVMVYQPKVYCATGRLAGFEALVRWHHPTAGVILPDAFIGDMESLGLISRLTEQVLEQSLGWFAEYFGAHRERCVTAGREPLSLSINISARNLLDLEFADRLVARCSDLSVDPADLIFELTETSAMDDPTLSLDLLTRLRMKGFQLSIDDFGTGYSSMVQLVRLPFSEVKVDKSFVMTVRRSQESRTVIKSIVDLGRSLGLRTSAEGVEDAPSMELLRQVGCDMAQGFYIAPPMYGDRVLTWLAGYPDGVVLPRSTDERPLGG